MYSSSYPQASYPQSYPSVTREDKLGKKLLTDPLLNAVRWLKRRNPKEKLILGGVGALVVRTPTQSCQKMLVQAARSRMQPECPSDLCESMHRLSSSCGW